MRDSRLRLKRPGICVLACTSPETTDRRMAALLLRPIGVPDAVDRMLAGEMFFSKLRLVRRWSGGRMCKVVMRACEPMPLARTEAEQHAVVVANDQTPSGHGGRGGEAAARLVAPTFLAGGGIDFVKAAICRTDKKAIAHQNG